MAKIIKSAPVSDDVFYLNQIMTPLDVSCEPISTSTAEKSLMSEDACKHACDAAFEAGLAKGLEDGIQQARNRLNEQLASIDTLLKSIPDALASHRHQQNLEIVHIVFMLAQQMFIHQQHNKESLTKTIGDIITQLNEQQLIKIALHPHDLRHLQTGNINLSQYPSRNIQLIADESLRLGGCTVTCEHGVYDASIERQVEQLKHVLLTIQDEKKHE